MAAVGGTAISPAFPSIASPTTDPKSYKIGEHFDLGELIGTPPFQAVIRPDGRYDLFGFEASACTDEYVQAMCDNTNRYVDEGNHVFLKPSSPNPKMTDVWQLKCHGISLQESGIGTLVNFRRGKWERLFAFDVIGVAKWFIEDYLCHPFFGLSSGYSTYDGELTARFTDVDVNPSVSRFFRHENDDWNGGATAIFSARIDFGIDGNPPDVPLFSDHKTGLVTGVFNPGKNHLLGYISETAKNCLSDNDRRIMNLA